MSSQWHEVHIHFPGDDPNDLEMFINHVHPEEAADCDLSLYLANSDWEEIESAGPGLYLVRVAPDGVLEICQIEAGDSEVIDLTEDL